MNKQVSIYREQVGELAKQFTDENRTYFQKLSNYLWTASFFYAEEEVWEQIYQFATDLLMAQDEGESAEEFFGGAPKEMADQLIKGFKRETNVRQVKWIVYIVGLTTATFLLTSFGNNASLQLNLVEFLMMIVFDLLLVSVLVLMLHHTIYDSKSKLFNVIKNNKILRVISLWLIFCFIIGGGALIIIALPKNLAYTVPRPFDIILIGALCLALSVVVCAIKAKVFRPFLILIWCYTLPGFLRRISALGALFSTDNGVWLTTGCTMLGSLLFAAVFVFYAKKELAKQKNT